MKFKIFYLFYFQLIFYVCFAFFGPIYQFSDSEVYLQTLNKLILDNKIYPNSDHIFNNFVNNPGAVNIYLLIFKIFNSNNIRILFLFNAVCIVLGNIFIFKTIKDNRLHFLFIVLTTFYLTNLSLVNTIASEVVSYFLFSFLIYYISKFLLISKSIFHYLFLGIFLGFFDYIRPIGLIFLIALLLFLLFNHLKNSQFYNYVLIFSLLFGFAACKFSIGEYHIYKTGYKINGSISLGYNLLMGSGTDSDGSWTGGVYDLGGKGHFVEIKSTNVIAKDKRWINQSLDSIKSNPTLFVFNGFRKLGLTFGYDLFGIHNLTKPNERNLSLGLLLRNYRIGIFNWLLIIVNNFIYLYLFVCFLMALIRVFYTKEIFVSHNINLVFVIFVILYILLIFIVIGGARYHHILIPIMLYFNFNLPIQFKNIKN